MTVVGVQIDEVVILEDNAELIGSLPSLRPSYEIENR
jgi:hypothetical protein